MAASAAETLACLLARRVSENSELIEQVWKTEQDKTLELSGCLAAHKYHVALDRSEEARMGSGMRALFFICYVQSNFREQVCAAAEYRASAGFQKI